MSKAQALLDALNEKTAENPKYRSAAKRMIANIQKRSPGWKDHGGKTEQKFVDNMHRMKAGGIRRGKK